MGTLVFQSIISSKARDIPSKFAQYLCGVRNL